MRTKYVVFVFLLALATGCSLSKADSSHWPLRKLLQATAAASDAPDGATSDSTAGASTQAAAQGTEGAAPQTSSSGIVDVLPDTQVSQPGDPAGMDMTASQDAAGSSSGAGVPAGDAVVSEASSSDNSTDTSAVQDSAVLPAAEAAAASGNMSDGVEASLVVVEEQPLQALNASLPDASGGNETDSSNETEVLVPGLVVVTQDLNSTSLNETDAGNTTAAGEDAELVALGDAAPADNSTANATDAANSTNAGNSTTDVDLAGKVAAMAEAPLNATAEPDTVSVLGYDTGMSAGTIAGISIAAVATAGVLVGASVWAARRKQDPTARKYSRYNGDLGNL